LLFGDTGQLSYVAAGSLSACDTVSVGTANLFVKPSLNLRDKNWVKNNKKALKIGGVVAATGKLVENHTHSPVLAELHLRLI
jgi:hypothetical protein